MLTQAVILAGGQGTRIKELTKDEISKVMLPVNHKPFLYYILMYLKGEGIRNIILCVGHKKETIKEYFGDGSKLGIEINYIEENVPLGTAGAIKNAEKFIMDESFFLLNGDTFSPISLGELFGFHNSKSAVVTIALKEIEDCYRYGRVELDKDFCIRSFTEKGIHQPGLINSGIYVVQRSILNSVKRNTFVSLEKDILAFLVGRGLYGRVFDSYFIDIGVPEDYFKANDEIQKYFNI